VTAETKRIVLAALDRIRGDDYLRAMAAFRGLTPAEMQQQHGASGRTRQQILDDYVAHAAAIDKAVFEVRSL
jgi:hypothetical protein